MGKLRVPSIGEFIVRLREEGFLLLQKRGKGDHQVWRHPDGRQVTVDGPNRKRPGIGLFKEMLRQSGISEDEYR